MKLISKIISLTSMIFITTACSPYVNLKSPIDYVFTNDQVSVYKTKTYNYYINLGFSHEAAKLMLFRYEAMFLEYDIMTRKNAKRRSYDRKGMPFSVREAKNVFACLILDGRTINIVNKKDDIERYVSEYTSMYSTIDGLDTHFPIERYSKSMPESERKKKEELNKKRQALRDKVMKDKFGDRTIDRAVDKLALLVEYSSVFESCGIYNEPEDYLMREDAKNIDQSVF